jgi:hypothetical protein
VIAAVVAAAAAIAALPEGTVRYRAELGGIAVGVAEVRISCAAAGCAVRWGTRLRVPAESGGGISEAAIDVPVDREGRYRGGPIRVRRSGVDQAPAGEPGAVPASIVEVVLAGEAARDGAPRCVPFFDEERPQRRRACARREGDGLAAEIGGVAARIVAGEDGFPAEVDVAGRFRWIRDAAAEVPRDAPRLAGTAVAGPADPRTARAFCGAPVDPPVEATLAAGLPAADAEGQSCREKTARWLAAARARGLDGRTAVGVAWDGRGFVWHSWAEVRAGGGTWIPVDPSFGEAPARGPRFTLARFAQGDAASRDAAGVRILECWGTAKIE